MILLVNISFVTSDRDELVSSACNPSTLAPQYSNACRAANVLQASWFSITLGLPGCWKTTAFWGSANTLTSLVDFMRVSNSSDFKSAVDQCHSSHPADVIISFSDGSYDDPLWWVLSYLDAYDLFQEVKYLNDAKKIFDHVWDKAWDDTVCNGGLWWSSKKSYKNAITNELAIDSAIRLHFSIGSSDKKYLDIAKKVGTWFLGSGMLNEHGMVDDGLNSTCQNNGDPNQPYSGWTYNQGVILGGLAKLTKATNDSSFIKYAYTIASTTISHRVTNNTVLDEIRVSNRDGQQFKGIFIRYLSIFLDFLSPTEKIPFKQFLNININSVMKSDISPSFKFGSLWQGPVYTKDCGGSASPSDPEHCVGATPQTAVIDLLNQAS